MAGYRKINVKIEKLLIKSEHTVKEGFLHYLYNMLGQSVNSAVYYHEQALSYMIRDRLVVDWKKTWQAYNQTKIKRAAYLSMEFLIGRSMANNLVNLNIEHVAQKTLYDLGLSLEEIETAEREAGLGNGGLGRLAACFMDSCATLGLPVMGYGLRYEYGMFRQSIESGHQVEYPDHWLQFGYPWEISRRENIRRVKFGGVTTKQVDPKTGKTISIWKETEDILAIPYDVPIPGFRNKVVNTLRLWSAAAEEEFNLSAFNAGSYAEAVAGKNHAGNITMVLYPNDENESGKVLRLRQQYFLVSASLQDVVSEWRTRYGENFSDFAEYNVFQLNDTHPSLAVVELMRILLDDVQLDWDEAWNITNQTMAYTNHTLLPEALERWPIALFESLLPRLLEIIYGINHFFLEEVANKWPGDFNRLREMSLIDEHNMVRMAYLAIVGSFSVNGVAALHSSLLKENLFHYFYELWPHKFNNKTNGVTQRRWIAVCNPMLCKLLYEKIGDSWITDSKQLAKIEAHVEDKVFCKQWHQVKQGNKARLAKLVYQETGIQFNIDAMFDVQVKRIHEYKRQLLNILHVVHLYAQIKAKNTLNWVNRCVLIGGKAAPGYMMAKSIIKLINNVANVVNNDPEVGDKLKVVFFPNYRVAAMEIICPGADLSEQISTAGKEASGTGNMKFMMNGAVTIGTLDGANVEILKAVGQENFFLFGLKASEVAELHHHYEPYKYIEESPQLQTVMHLLESGHFNQNEPRIFDAILHAMLSPHDPWMTLADFSHFIQAQEHAAEAYQDQARWTQMSIINSARSGCFSSDRTVQEYNKEIWKLEPIKIKASTDC